MRKSCVSNPPYNVSWELSNQALFFGWPLPPAPNANLAFIISALEMITDKAAFIMPVGLLSSSNKDEMEVKSELVARNYLSAVILLPPQMFESTSIPVCVLLFDKTKKDEQVTFIDHRDIFEAIVRKQRGQYGGASHTGRVYEKVTCTLTDEMINKIVETINGRKSEIKYSASINNSEITSDWVPGKYIEHEREIKYYRPILDILKDIKRVGDSRNAIKLTINENLAKQYGPEITKDDIIAGNQIIKDINERTARFFDIELPKNDYLSLTKNKNEIMIKCNSDEGISAFFALMLPMIKQRMIYFNNEENRLLIELRDALTFEIFENAGKNLPEGMMQIE